VSSRSREGVRINPDTFTVSIEGRRVAVTNLDKVLWPASGMTKGELLQYYVAVAPTLLPHLRGRPLTLRRFPDGVEGASWHQNECRGEPEWLTVFETGGRQGRVLRFCMVEDLASLVWIVNQGSIELHPFSWHVDAPRQPTQLVFDLDPGPPAGIVECARIALELRGLLAELGLVSLAKTSGSLGLHVHVPLGTPHDGAEVKEFAKLVARAIGERLPDEVVGEVHRSRRAGKVYVDWLQNDPTRQTVAPYSLRGLPFPTVAAPVTWDEVERAAASADADCLTFLHDEVVARIETHGDLFAPLNELEQRLPASDRA
jgi:bifunctional non-homologous end joining protein LigD